MQESVRKELKDLCLDILKQDDNAELNLLIEHCQNLLQKLLVADYLAKHLANDEAPAVEEKQVETASTEPIQTSSAPEVIAEESLSESPVSVVEPVVETPKEMEQDAPQAEQALGLDDFQPIAAKPTSPNAGSINERFAQGTISFGLNDRIAFVKHLFGDDMNDFNRVVSQLNTFEDFEEAEQFIENMVKPDYDWAQKAEFELRFKNRIRQRFGLDELE